MIKGKNILIVGAQSWDISIGSNCKNIETEFAKNNQVIYVNVPLDRKNYFKCTHINKNYLRRIFVLKGRSTCIVKLVDKFKNFYPKIVIESANWIKNKTIYNFFNKLNAKRLALEIQRITKQLEFENHILFNDSFMCTAIYLKELLNLALPIYYIRDYFKRHGVRLEKKLLN